jgi:hypothetical protein
MFLCKAFFSWIESRNPLFLAMGNLESPFLSCRLRTSFKRKIHVFEGLSNLIGICCIRANIFWIGLEVEKRLQIFFSVFWNDQTIYQRYRKKCKRFKTHLITSQVNLSYRLHDPRGGATLACKLGGGGTQFGRLDRKPGTLWYSVVRTGENPCMVKCQCNLTPHSKPHKSTLSQSRLRFKGAITQKTRSLIWKNTCIAR